ncbi:MAG: hypothetical protein M3R53_04655 [Candidatus Eremiobacteraeota bacterium]|nr:hypothetical protein [Candidatus Eremiobacteraeota bacterium]
MADDKDAGQKSATEVNPKLANAEAAEIVITEETVSMSGETNAHTNNPIFPEKFGR